MQAVLVERLGGILLTLEALDRNIRNAMAEIDRLFDGRAWGHFVELLIDPVMQSLEFPENQYDSRLELVEDRS